MGPIFQINENVKESLVLNFAAKKAKTVYHKNGSIYLSDPFLETEITWESIDDFRSLSMEEATKLGSLLRDLQFKVTDLGGQMTPPMFEYIKKSPTLVWAQFFTNGTEKNL